MKILQRKPLLTILYLLTIFYPFFLSAECDKENFITAIDIGHTKEKAGATSARGTGEFYFNREIANRLYHTLLDKGFSKTFIINPDGKSIQLKERVNIAEERQANLFIAIHHDSVQPHYLSTWLYGDRELSYSDKFRGYSIFYSEEGQDSENSLLFATILGRTLLSYYFTPTLHHAEKIKGENRELIDPETGIYRFDNLIVLKQSVMPAVLLECGVIMNRDEEILLSNPVYQNALVLAIVDSIDAFCGDSRRIPDSVESTQPEQSIESNPSTESNQSTESTESSPSVESTESNPSVESTESNPSTESIEESNQSTESTPQSTESNPSTESTESNQKQ